MGHNADMNGYAERKKEARATAAAKRDSLPAERRKVWSAAACRAAQDWIRGLREDRLPSNLMVYVPFRTELDTGSLIEWAWGEGIDVIVPRCVPSNRRMDLYVVRGWDQLVPGAYGIREPDASRTVRLEESFVPDVVFVPGLAFDREGGRLGYGGGYYDRFLDRLGESVKAGHAPPPWIGLGFEAQWMPAVPMDAHDARVQAVATERGVFPAKPQN